MRDNIRSRQQAFGLSLGVKQVSVLLVGAMLMLATAFALGLGLGRRSSAATAEPAPGSRDALARLDEPLAAKAESPPELKAHQALTDPRSIEKTLPMPLVNAAKAPASGAGLEEKRAPENEVVMPPAIAMPSAAPSPTAPPAQDAQLPQARREAREARPAVRPAASPDPSRARPGSKGAFTIQVASAQHRADAERLAKQLAARKARVVAAEIPGKGRWYRVQIGSYDTREAATQQLASLAVAGVHGIVTPAH